MEMNYFKKTGKMMVAACMLAGLPFIPGTVSASELQTQMMSVQMESTTLKELFDLIEEKFNYTFLIRNNDINLNERISIDMSNRSVEEILTTALKNHLPLMTRFMTAAGSCLIILKALADELFILRTIRSKAEKIILRNLRNGIFLQ